MTTRTFHGEKRDPGEPGDAGDSGGVDGFVRETSCCSERYMSDVVSESKRLARSVWVE